MRGKRRAVVEFRFRPDEELIGQAVGRAANFCRGEAVHGVRLVAGADHQRGESQLHALRRIALEDEGVERIESEKILIVDLIRPDLREFAALRRVRIDVVEVRKIRRIAEIAEGRQAVRFDEVVGARRPRSGADNAEPGERAGGSLRMCRRVGRFMSPRLTRLCGFLPRPTTIRSERRPAVFGHRIGMAEAVPARGADLE